MLEKDIAVTFEQDSHFREQILLTVSITPWLQILGLLILLGSLAFLGFLALPKLSQFLLERFASSQIAIAYKQIVEPSLLLIQIVFGLAIADIFLLQIKPIIKISFLEILLSLSKRDRALLSCISTN